MCTHKRSCLKGLKICCCITAIFLTISIVVSVILFFTVFKPKQPKVTAHPVSLQNIEFTLSPTVSLNVTLRMIVSIDNRNYGSFRFQDTTSYVNYRGANVGEVAIGHTTVPARGKLNITADANISAGKLISNPDFWSDLGRDRLDFTSSTTLHGKVSALKIIKMEATIFSICQITIFLLSQEIDSTCNAKIKL